MADELTLTVKAQVAEAIKNLAEVQASLTAVAATTAKTNAAGGLTGFMGAVGQDAKNFVAGVQGVARGTEEAAGKVRSFAQDLAQLARGFLMNIGAMSPFIGILTLAGVGFGLATIINATKQWDDNVYKLSLDMNGNVRAASQWLGIAGELGVSADALTTGFKFLSQNIDKNNPVLRDMGIATQDARGNLLPLVDVLQQARDWFQAHAGATDLAAKAVELFGRGGQQLLPVLMLEKGAFDAVTSELEKMGMIESSQTLSAQRAFEAELDGTTNSLHALEVGIGHALMPALAVLAQALQDWVANNLDKVARAVANVAAFFVGLLNGLFGLNLNLNQLAVTLGQVKDSFGNTGTAADSMADSTKGAADATRELRYEMQGLDDQMRALDEESRSESQADAMIRLQEQKTAKQKEVEKLRSDYDQALLVGDLAAASSIFDQLANAQQSLGDTERDITKQTDDYNRQKQKDALTAQKENLQRQIDAVQQANDATVRSTGIATADMTGLFSNMATAVQNIMSSSGTQAGQDFADRIKQVLFGNGTSGGLLNGGTINQDMNNVGHLLGAAFLKGFEDEVKSQLSSWWDNFIQSSFHPTDQQLAQSGAMGALATGPPIPEGSGWKEPDQSHPGKYFHYDSNFNYIGEWAVGYTVPGTINSPRLATLHGGERVSPANSLEARRSALQGGHTFNISVSGASDPRATADAVWQEVSRRLSGAMGYA